MFLLPVVVLGVLIGYLLGGRLGRIAEMRLRAPWLFYVAIGLQLLAFPSLFMPWHASEGIATALSIGSYGCLLAVFLLNLRLTGMPIAGAGMLLNLAAILSNGGHMPALPAAMRQAGLSYTGVHNNSVADSSPNLVWFVDRWAAPSWVPFGNVYSAGDVLIGLGAVVLVVAAMGVRLPLRRPAAVAAETDPGYWRAQGAAFVLRHTGSAAEQAPPTPRPSDSPHAPIKALQTVNHPH
jgi:hypothetical protein